MIARAGSYPGLLEPRVVDLFAGAGGASTGIEEAFVAGGLDRGVDVAINHDPDAIACHELNHPLTHHLQADVFEVDPDTVGGSIGLLWASPDCTDFSKAKGGRPIRSTKRRSLAWVVVHWAFVKRPDVILLENVEEFQQWGPLRNVRGPRGSWRVDLKTMEPLLEPDPERRGETFEVWVESLRYLGYAVEWRELRACDYGTPTTRKRLFVVARRDGKPIVWPEKTHDDAVAVHSNPGGAQTTESRRGCLAGSHEVVASRNARCVVEGASGLAGSYRVDSRHGEAEHDEGRGGYGRQPPAGGAGSSPDLLGRRDGGLAPYRTAADIIDWSIPMLSIFATPDEAGAFAREHGVGRPRRPLKDNTLRRIARGLVRYVINDADPFLVPYHREREGQSPRVRSIRDPLATVATAPMGVVDASLAPYVVGAGGSAYAGKPVRVDRPLGVVKGDDRRGLVAAFIAKHYGDTGQRPGIPMTEPVSTVTGNDHHALATAYLSRSSNSDVVWGAGDRNASAKEPVGTITGRYDQQLVALNLSHFYTSNTAGGQGDLRQPKKTVLAGANHAALVASFLTKYYGEGGQDQRVDRPLDTVVGVDRFGLVTVVLDGEPWVVVDIAMRMLTPRELARAQGFRDDYVIDRAAPGSEGGGGRLLTKRTQVRLIGNSVCRDVARALVLSNVVGVCDWARALRRVA